MDLTPPSLRSDPRPKSASRLAPVVSFSIEEEDPTDPIQNTPSPSPSPLPLRELLLLSPSPRRRSRTRLADRLGPEDPPDPTGPSRRRCKARGAQMGLLGCASPRSNRRPRRRPEPEIREEKDLGLSEEVAKVMKKKRTGRPKKEKQILISSPRIDDCGGGSNLDRIGQAMTDLIMWRDLAKSTLWFGFGSICFLSSCFTEGLSFSFFSAMSQLGLLLLGASFLSNSIYQRNNADNGRDLNLKEDDVLRLARLVLPAINLVMSKTRALFSGEPAMTLKVVPFLLLGAEYGHLITLWRLSALGFFISFSVPKLYSNHSVQINQKVEYLKCCVMEAWRGCSHKKKVMALAVTAFWNLSSVKTRIFTAFISLVIIRYCRQHLAPNLEGESKEEESAEQEQEKEQEQEQALVVVAKQ